MKRCPITYEIIPNEDSYSQKGLRWFSPRLTKLEELEYSALELREKAFECTGKMSLQGVQPKLSARLNVKEGYFELVDRLGHYILKPPHANYPELPENEALTMSLAAMIGIDVPVHGLLYAKDKTMTYVIKRFDRVGHNERLPVEDFAQLLQLDRETKYMSSMEKVAKVVKQFCTFPKVEAIKLLKLSLFNFLIGNEDMHLKNFSLITRDHITTFSPAYDLLNTTIVIRGTEELALPLSGKKKNLKKADFFSYAFKQLDLNQVVVDNVVENIRSKLEAWQELISKSFLSEPMQKKYLSLLEERARRLFG